MPPPPENPIRNDVPRSRAPGLASQHLLAKAWEQQRAGALASAESLGMQILQTDAGNAEAWTLLGTVAWQMGMHQAALGRFQRALALAPEIAVHHTHCGIVLQALRRHEESEAAFRESVRLEPDRAETRYNLATALRELRRFAEAEEQFRQAIRLRPGFAQARNNLAACLQELGRFAEAEACFRQALSLQPGLPEVHYNLALLLLLTGDYANGWQEYEWRGQLDAFAVQRFRQPDWDGSALAGQRLLLQCEQGLGDTLQFVRYARRVQERGARVMLHCPDRLIGVLRSCAGLDQLIPLNLAPPPFDLRVPLMSLPRLLGTRMDSIPAAIPYLWADPSLTKKWHALLPGSEFKVGIVWQGNPKHPKDRERSVPLSVFEPLSRVPGVRLVSLQVGPGQEQIEANGERLRVMDLGSRFDPAGFHDVAAVVQSLDLVVTVDSAIAHLAGALGVRTWIALPFVPDWRWLLDRDDSPWYPSVRLFRQQRNGDWESVFARMADALGEIGS
jgi:Flp pilus assembly protein TadD